MTTTLPAASFFKRVLDQRPFPLYGQWELTCRCNLHCVMCYTDPFNTPEKIRQELSTTEILRILNEMADEGCLKLILTGGEPLLRHDFFDIYEAAHRRGLLLTLFTNGTLLTEHVADHLAQFLPERVEISLHGMSPSVFERVSDKKGSLEPCLRAILFLIDRKIPVTLKSTAMTLNEEEVLAVKKWANDLSAEGHDVRFRLSEEMRPRLDGREDVFRFALSPERLQNMESQDLELAAAKKREAESLDAFACPSGLHSFHIDAYGQLQLCSGNRRAGYDLRKGSFREGFYKAIPTFPCRFKIATASET